MKKEEPDYMLVLVQSPEDWGSYHRIRKEELFDPYPDRINIYDANRPEERAPGKFPLLLKLRKQPIGTTRLDVRDDGTAVIRLVAITKAEQRKGHGRMLAQQVEAFAKLHHVQKLLVNANPDAVGYYAKLGYARDDWDPAELRGISADSIQMSKMLA